MKTIFVDDEPWSLAYFKEECLHNPAFEVVGVFDNAAAALAYAQLNQVDFALLDVEMPQMNGLTLGKKLKELYPQIILIYVTAHSYYSIDVMAMKADYLITKPYTVADVTDVLTRACLLAHRQRKPVFIRTFGSFEVFVNNIPISFSSAKAKELLALLVDRRGGILSSDEVLSLMWEDKPHDDSSLSLCRKAALRLHKILEEYGIAEIVKTCKNGRFLDYNLVDCDYYLFLAGDDRAKNSFTGEYMSQYSWGEYTLAELVRIQGAR